MNNGSSRIFPRVIMSETRLAEVAYAFKATPTATTYGIYLYVTNNEAAVGTQFSIYASSKGAVVDLAGDFWGNSNIACEDSTANAITVARYLAYANSSSAMTYSSGSTAALSFSSERPQIISRNLIGQELLGVNQGSAIRAALAK
jgi:hypothetical protein